jgi:succinate dehydrogenase / fumarate reductase iron-sulfur subunit
MLFVGAKVSQYGNCTNTGACEVECPKGISLENIARMNREYLKASLK